MADEVFIRLKAEQERNGNPRRCYLVLCCDTGNVLEVIDEGYKGVKAVYSSYPEAREGPDIKVPVKEYKSWVAWQHERTKDLRSQRNKSNGMLGDLLRQARDVALGKEPGNIHETIRNLAIHLAEGNENPDWRGVLTMHMNALAQSGESTDDS